jgi:Flp pilus assembly protein protease CpaA
LYMAWIDIAAFALATIAVLLAAIIDLRTMRIPNALTLPSIAVGLAILAVRCGLGFSPLWAVAICAVAYALVYGLWKGGLWGGGDAKLVLAIFLLISPMYSPFYLMAIYLACLAIALFLGRYLFFGADRNHFQYALSPLIVSSGALALLWGFGHTIAAVGGLVAFAVAADLLADSFPCTERVPIGRAEGRRIAEEIHVTDQAIVRKKICIGIIRGMFRRQNYRTTVLRPCDIDMLRRYVKSVEVFVQRPMGPSLFVAYVLALALPAVLS